MSYYPLISIMPKAQPLLLDTYSGASAAYSLRKLRTAYSGNAIRVRRSSDNTEQDFGFVANVLDTASLLTFCGAGNGFVTTWYDQSGNGSNAVQTTAANQPQIVSSGSVILANTKPALQFDGTNDNMPINIPFVVPSQVSAFGVRSFTSYPNTYRTLFDWKGYGITYNSNGGSQYGIAHIFRGQQTTKSTNYPTTTGQALDTIITQLFTASLFKRNLLSTTISAGDAYTYGSSSIGSWNGTSFAFLGNIQELVIYEFNQTSNVSPINSNINTYYSIY